AAKALVERGIAFDWFEKGSMVGGLWQIDNDNGATPGYRSLHLNSSRPRTQYPSFPMPPDWPDYPSHALMAQYFERFAEHFGLTERITFQTPVVAVSPVPGGPRPGSRGWLVTPQGQPPRTYQEVLVCNGHHHQPRIPTLPGNFAGQTLHSSSYRDPALFAGKDVVVVGVGNSGMDIACDAVATANRVWLVTRHGVHVLPKYALSKPIDQLGSPLTAYVPFALERRIYELIVKVSTGTPESRGMPKPDHRLLEAHPTVSADLYDRVGHGDIQMKPDIDRLDDDMVHFVDGSSVHADVLVYATGYEVSFPFFDQDVWTANDNELPLFQRVVAPDRPGLYFIGFVQSVGANIPLMEYQSDWIADVMAGEVVLPSEPDMRAWIRKDRDRMAKRYVRSPRHTMQVDYWRYIRAMKEARMMTATADWKARLKRPLAGLLPKPVGAKAKRARPVSPKNRESA
ncbi:MAG: NAD(P)-binding domain-containing protein, partial [Actinomycetia bacterium]|nr:NAD(P)-binding domain-containing protein [Actinomycetes bacterium]